MRYKVYSENRGGEPLWVIYGTSNEAKLYPQDSANGSVVLEIDTGRMFVKRGGSWAEISSGANMRAGRINLPAGGTVNVSFGRDFRQPPVVTATLQFQSNDFSTNLSVSNVTASGFTLTGAGNEAGPVGWIAVEL